MESWQIAAAAFIFTVLSNVVTFAVARGRTAATTESQIKHLEATITDLKATIEGRASTVQIKHIESLLGEREKDIQRVRTDWERDIARLEGAVNQIHEARHAFRKELLEQQKGYWFEVTRRLDEMRAEMKRMDANICTMCRHK
jgi:peptidoglycan hydrolase CwlO-like protein